MMLVVNVPFLGPAADELTEPLLASGLRPHHAPLRIRWTAVTAAVMFALAADKARTGTALDNPVLMTEGRVTLIDGLPAAEYVLVYYALCEVKEIFFGEH